MNTEKGSRSIRALEVLEAFVATGRAMGISDVMDHTGLPKATVHRLLSLLESEGFLVPEIAGKRLTLGHRARGLAMGIMALSSADAYSHQVLTDLSKKIGETCNLNVPSGNEILYVDRVETEWPLRTQLPVGSRVPLHCTASGKLYLASLPPSKRRRLIARMGLAAHTENTITDTDKFEAELERTRQNGYAVDDEEFIEGMVALAVPVRDERRRLAAILAFHAPVARMNMTQALEHLQALNEAADALSADLAPAD